MLCVLRGSGSVWRNGGRAWMGTTSAVEDVVIRSREGGSCTVPLVFTKFDAKVVEVERKEGKRPPVLLLHGLLGSQMTYRSLVKRKDFAPKRDVYTVDMRNHGQSPHVSEMDLHSLSRDVTKLMDTEGLEKACLIGHSVGGKVAMILALEQPKRVSELVVVDIAPVDSQTRMGEVTTAVNAMHDIDIENYRNKKDISHALEEHGVKDERIRQFLMTNVVSDESDIGFYKWKLHIQAIQEALPQLRSFPTYEEGRTFDGPTLFTYGEMSAFSVKEDESAVKKLFPRAQMKQINGAGHWLQAEKPEEFCKALNDFLNDDSP